MQSVIQFKEEHESELAASKLRLVKTKDQVGNFTNDPAILENMINFYSEKLDRCNGNSKQDIRDSKKVWIDGIIAIFARYSPNQSEYEFVETIVNKLYNCNQNWNTNLNLPSEKIIRIYQALIDCEPLEQVLNKFSYRDLGIYGW